VITHILTHAARSNYSGLPAPYKGKLEILQPGPAGDAGYEFGDGSTGSTRVELAARIGDRQHHYSLNGTHLAVDNNGDVFVNFKAHPNDNKNLKAGSVYKKLVIQNEGQDFLRIENTSDGLKVFLGEALADSILVQIADGAKSAAIAEYLETMWGSLKSWLELHTHSTGTGPSGPPLNNPATAWNASIASTKVLLPDG
jgi:hypothetical protein